MFDSSWNSNAFQTFCGQVGIIRNGDRNVWILVNASTGEPIGNTVYNSEADAEEARRKAYDHAR